MDAIDRSELTRYKVETVDARLCSLCLKREVADLAGQLKRPRGSIKERKAEISLKRVQQPTDLRRTTEPLRRAQH